MKHVSQLKLAIVASGRPQKEIAAALGMDQTTLSRIVNGWRCTDLTRAAIARELGRPVDELFPEHRDEANHPQPSAHANVGTAGKAA